MVRKGVFSEREAREVFESVLLVLEQAQALSGADQDIFAMAREQIEGPLRRSVPKPPQK